MDTYLTPGSLRAARAATGGLLQLVDRAFGKEGAERRGLALCRPPGHHASAAKSSGFCLVNNVAVAAAYALKRHGAARVLIFDWDVHHCNGTQAVFEDSPEVLVVSAHRHDGQKFYPATGAAKEVGLGKGKGYTVNVALSGSFGDAALWAASAEVLAPAARAFRPDLILVSAGFDAVTGDPLGGCDVAPRLFGALTREICALAEELCEGRVLFGLEGGYHLEALADCIEEVAQALLDAPAGPRPEAEPAAFAQQPAWLEGTATGAYQRAAIRKTCEAHKGLALKLRVPLSKSEQRKAEKAALEARGEALPRRAAATNGHASEAALKRCPAGHGLAVFVTDDEFECSICAGDVGAGVQMWGCRACDYDVCARCLPSKARPPAGGAVEEEEEEAQAAVDARPDCLIFRIAPLSRRPVALDVAADELRLLYADGASLRWRLAGAEAEPREGVAACIAEWRSRLRELRLYCGLKALTGGPVSLSRLPG